MCVLHRRAGCARDEEDTMANYKNKKPKSYKGHCALCSLRTTNGKRNGRQGSISELRAEQAEAYYWEQEYSYEEEAQWDT